MPDGVAAPELEASQRVANQDAANQREQRRADRHHHRVPDPARELRLRQEIAVVVQRHAGQGEGIAPRIQQELIRLERHDQHPEKGKEQKDAVEHERNPQLQQALCQDIAANHETPPLILFADFAQQNAGEERQERAASRAQSPPPAPGPRSPSSGTRRCRRHGSNWPVHPWSARRSAGSPRR